MSRWRSALLDHSDLRVIGLYVAWVYDYITPALLKDVAEALIAVFLWFLSCSVWTCTSAVDRRAGRPRDGRGRQCHGKPVSRQEAAAGDAEGDTHERRHDADDVE